MNKMEYLVLDANVIISAIKGTEEHSPNCRNLLTAVWDEYYLIEPRIILLEVVNSIFRHLGRKAAEKVYNDLTDAVYLFQDFTTNKELKHVAEVGASYNIYAIDSLYLTTALKNKSTLISLDKKDFIDKIRAKDPSFKAYHVSELPAVKSSRVSRQNRGPDLNF